MIVSSLLAQVTQLDSSVEEVTLQEIQLRKAFRSTQIFDQQVAIRIRIKKGLSGSARIDADPDCS